MDEGEKGRREQEMCFQSKEEHIVHPERLDKSSNTKENFFEKSCLRIKERERIARDLQSVKTNIFLFLILTQILCKLLL